MSNLKIKAMQEQIDKLNSELQLQKGMLWVIGEIIKNATNITSYRELMKSITDMVMGVMGVCSCYLWIGNSQDGYTLHYRSILLKNSYSEMICDDIPEFLKERKKAKPSLDFNIKTPLIKDGGLPGSRLSVPLYDFQREIPIGFLVVEHESKDFFTETTTLLFETLAIFIGSNSKNSKLFETVNKETRHDPLTKIFNRKFLDQFLDSFSPNNKPLSLCIFDIDFFKYVNDIHGHAKGDEVLIAIANTTYSLLKQYDGKAIRYGGDEFVVLLELPIDLTIPILEELRVSIPKLPIMQSIGHPVTITMGVSSYPEHTDNVYQLLPLADSALLQGKSLGRNMVKVGTKNHLG